MAPPGTYTLLPQAVPRRVVDLTSDDPPVERDPEEEDIGGSNIRPSGVETFTSTSRVEETPEKPTFNLSRFAYDSNANRKRSAPESSTPLSSPPRDKRPRPMPRQTGPSRAMPVQVDLELNDIPDYDMKKNVERLKAIFTHKSIQDLYDALVSKRGNYQDAMDLIAQSSEDELIQSPKFFAKPLAPAYPPKKTAQRGLKAPTQTIQEKFSHRRNTQIVIDSDDSPEKPKPRRRLIQGRRKRSPSPQPVPQQSKPIKIDSDEDEGINVISDESEAEVEEETEFDVTKLLEFFNTCTVEAMVDLSSQKEDDIRAVLDQRPFPSLSKIEKIHIGANEAGKKKGRGPKITFGKRLLESATAMWSGFEAVDELVTKCKDRGKPIVSTMASWGVDVSGKSTDGELALTNLDDSSDTSSMRDSGIGTPRSSHESDTDEESIRKVRRIVGRASSGRPTLLKKPTNMSADIELKDYQIVGLNWLNLLWQHEVSGILADDMGLGKTCQVIAFLSHLKEKNVPGPHLIVVPGSTLENWLREFMRFSPDLEVEPYYGSQGARNEQQEYIMDELDKIYVIVTTYDVAFKKADSSFLRKCKPQACIFDEGHYLRNSNTQRYQSLMRITAKCRFLLTGTPLQNSLRELASILAFIMPDIFKEVEENLEVVFKLKAKVNEADTHGALLSTQRVQRARSMMTPFILRRKKAQVLKHLPEKTCRVEYCELTESQSKLYTAQLEKQKKVLLDRAAGKPSKEHANVMMRLRQAAIHPLLLRDRYDDSVIRKMSKACLREATFENSDPDVIFEELQLYQDYQCHQLATKYPKALGKFALKDEWMDSGKIQKLAEILRKFKENGDRTLVFSQFTSMMDILQWVLDTLDISYSRLDGSTPIAERQPLLDQFYKDESIHVFMLSTKSGGAGINLACANKVIIFDSSFNPQDDVQAENRAHRVGQTREVEVIRLVTKGTVEEQIHALGLSKLELDKMVSGEDDTTKTKKSGDKLSAVEEMGLEAVEQMMMEKLKEETGDIKDEFLDGLKAAGLDMSAA